jgi:uncharacterized protein
MLPLIEQKRQEIAAACARFGVARLDVFGSSLGDDFRPGVSDVDLLVEFAPMDAEERLDAYFALGEALEGILGVEVDLVTTGAIRNRYVAAEIDRTKRLLYAA